MMTFLYVVTYTRKASCWMRDTIDINIFLRRNTIAVVIGTEKKWWNTSPWWKGLNPGPLQIPKHRYHVTNHYIPKAPCWVRDAININTHKMIKNGWNELQIGIRGAVPESVISVPNCSTSNLGYISDMDVLVLWFWQCSPLIFYSETSLFYLTFTWISGHIKIHIFIIVRGFFNDWLISSLMFRL